MKLARIRIRWFWILWNVAFPLLLPIVVPAFVVAMWTTGKDDFAPNPAIILDVSPWALIFFALALIGSTISEFWPKMSQRPGIGLGLFLLTVTVAIYASMMVIWRHDANFSPKSGVYYASGIFLICAIGVCHWAHNEIQKAIEREQPDQQRPVS